MPGLHVRTCPHRTPSAAVKRVLTVRKFDDTNGAAWVERTKEAVFGADSAERSDSGTKKKHAAREQAACLSFGSESGLTATTGGDQTENTETSESGEAGGLGDGGDYVEVAGSDADLVDAIARIITESTS